MTHVGHELSKLTVRRFLLRRDKDVSGVSGLGHVAEGVTFTDGTTILRWRAGTPTTNIFESPDAVERVHGHYGVSTLECLDQGITTPSPDHDHGCEKRDCCDSLTCMHHIAGCPNYPTSMAEWERRDRELAAWARAQQADELGVDRELSGLPIIEPSEETSPGVRAAALSIVLAGLVVLAYAAITAIDALAGWLL